MKPEDIIKARMWFYKEVDALKLGDILRPIEFEFKAWLRREGWRLILIGGDEAVYTSKTLREIGNLYGYRALIDAVPDTIGPLVFEVNSSEIAVRGKW